MPWSEEQEDHERWREFIRRAVRDEVAEALRVIDQRITTNEKVISKWDTALCVLRWGIGITVIAIGIVAQALDWLRDHWR